MSDNLAIAYRMKKKQKMAKGGACPECTEDMKCYAHGGEIEDSDRVERILKRRKYSEGGRVANETEDVISDAPGEFDDLVLRDDLEFEYTGKNSGDYCDNDQENKDRRDIVARIMRSRNKRA